jgi:hypothetical protein
VAGVSLFSRKTDAEPKVEWITHTPGLVENYPIVPARQVLPEWFRSSDTKVGAGQVHGPHQQAQAGSGTVVGPKTYSRDTKPTIRHCPGVVDVLRSGYLLRAWTDIEVTTPAPATGTDRDVFQANTGMRPDEIGGRVNAFGPAMNQRLPLHPGEYAFALKVDTPWTCKTPPGWSLLFDPVPFDEKRPFRVVPGITDSDAFHVINLIVMWSHHGSYLIEAGTPLCWLLPVHRDGFNMPTEVRFDPEYDAVLRTQGKGTVGKDGSRILHGSYILERARRRKAQ